MEVQNYINILNESPSLELLQTKHRSLTIPFLVHAFMRNEKAHSQKVLESILIDYLQYINYVEDSEDSFINTETLEIKAKRKIAEWRIAGFLYQNFAVDGTTIYELSQHSLRALNWIESQKRTEFIGTESKFKSVYDKIKELLEYTDEDIVKRKQILEKRKLDIQHKIDKLEAGEAVPVYNKTEITERFQDVLRIAKDLLIDFNEVEYNFKQISKEVSSKYASNEMLKKEALDLTFTALNELENSNQGKSFYAFWKFLIDTDYQEDWNKLTDELYSRLEKNEIAHQDTFLKNLKRNLNQAALKVTDANSKMASKVAKIIKDSGVNHKITQQLIFDIKKILVEISKQSREPEIGIEIESKTHFVLPLEPQLTYTIKDEVIFTKKPERAEDGPIETKSLKRLFEHSGVDLLAIRKRIKTALEEKEQTTLEEIIETNGGITEGLSELFGYIGELRKFKHQYNADKNILVAFDNATGKSIKIPEIILVR